MATVATTLSEALDIYNDRYQSALSNNSKREIDRFLSNINQINAYYDISTAAVSDGNTTLAQEALDSIVSILQAQSITISSPVTATAAVSIFTNPGTILIPTDNDGTNPVYTDAITDISIFQGNTEITDNFTYAITTLSDAVGTLTDNTLSITSIDADTGYIIVTASADGYSDLTITISVKKQPQGTPGSGVGGTKQNANLSIQAQDEGTVVGDARGVNAVDLQTQKLAADKVASGTSSIVIGVNSKASGNRSSAIGYFNTATNNDCHSIGGGNNNATGEYAIILGSNGSTASGVVSTIIGGGSSTASNTFSLIVGGVSNISSGEHSIVFGGEDNTSSGDYSTVINGLENTAQTYGEFVTGLYAEEISGDDDTWVSTDPLFRIGNGTSSSARSDAFKINKDGGIFAKDLKSGADQASAGAAATELWIDTTDNSIKIGV